MTTAVEAPRRVHMSKERFTVSTDGLRQLHAGREPWYLIKELVANAWDEDSTFCDVTVRVEDEGVRVVVVDDGPGFRNPEDAWTLMADTAKRTNADVRGRFNLGDKEVLSVAIEARINTVGKTISFPREGGRRVWDNTTERGTTVDVLMPWGAAEVRNVVTNLRRFRVPENQVFMLNGETIEREVPLRVFNAKDIQTMLASGPGQPMRQSRRNTDIEIYAEPECAYIYELGIPIQPIEGPWGINVMQKVPMPPNRDTVNPTYLASVYAETLNNCHDLLEEDDAADSWTDMGLEDRHVTPETIEAVTRKRYGDNVVFLSSDPIANEKAIEAGYQVINPRTVSKKLREALKKNGIVKSAKDTFRTTLDPVGGQKLVQETNVTPNMGTIGAYARWLARELLGIEISVGFYRAPGAVAADYGARTMRFNLQRLGHRWFECPDGVEQRHTDLILHELAHEDGSDMFSHGSAFTSSLSKLGALATHRAMQGGWFDPDNA